MAEPEVLIFRQLLCPDVTDSEFGQGWLLRTLHEDHGFALDALARRFDRSVSWVSRRVSLVRTLTRRCPSNTSTRAPGAKDHSVLTAMRICAIAHRTQPHARSVRRPDRRHLRSAGARTGIRRTGRSGCGCHTGNVRS